MRYLFGFLCVCVLGVVPQSATAQVGEEDSLSAWQADTAPKPAEEYSPQELRVRRRAGIGLGVSLAALVGGIAMVAYAVPESNFICIFECPPPPNWVAPVGGTGAVLMVGGLVGMIVSAVRLSRDQPTAPSRPDEEPLTPTEPTGL